MIKILEGNILDADETIICQQVNCKGVMGSGLAKQIRNKYPNVYTDYKLFCKTVKNPLGQVNSVVVQDKEKGLNHIIMNIFGQDGYGRDRRYTDYNALEMGLQSIYNEVTTEGKFLYGKSIAIPYNLGCGLAGGDWNVVCKIIEDVFNDYNVTIYKLV
jgi:O-acetyl-ADP-ribose deacetylase (regulator of RNase III)